MTGRTVDNNGNFVYNAGIHYTGPVKVLDFAHPNGSAAEGLALGDQYVHYLATHPATAKRIAHKLGRRFVCDDPPQTLVDRLAQSYLDNGTAIVPVLRTLFSSVEFWMSTGLKVRTPLENVLATARIVGVDPGSQDHRRTRRSLPDDRQPRTGAADLGPTGRVPRLRRRVGLRARHPRHLELASVDDYRLCQGADATPRRRPSSGCSRRPSASTSTRSRLRLVHQPMRPEHKAALLTFLGAEEATAVKDLRLGGKIDSLVPLILDSVYHALR